MEIFTAQTNSLHRLEPDNKNFLEIAGVAHKELVNSNLLAYYLDEKEEHGFGRLFFDSLLDLMVEKYDRLETDIFSTDYHVQREVYNIDILITSDTHKDNKPSWCIIIENKIHADLYNPLQKYYNNVKAAKKYGIVLSLDKCYIKNELSNKYINLTHEELCTKVRETLRGASEPRDSRQQVFLEEFLLNTENYYHLKKMNREAEENIRTIQKHSVNINETLQSIDRTKRYILNILDHKFRARGYTPTSSNLTDYKHYRNEKKKLRFYVNIENVLMHGELRICYETFGADAKTRGEKLKEQIQNRKEVLLGERLQIGDNTGSSYSHLASSYAKQREGESIFDLIDTHISYFFDSGLVSFCENPEKQGSKPPAVEEIVPIEETTKTVN